MGEGGGGDHVWPCTVYSTVLIHLIGGKLSTFLPKEPSGEHGEKYCSALLGTFLMTNFCIA